MQKENNPPAFSDHSDESLHRLGDSIFVCYVFLYNKFPEADPKRLRKASHMAASMYSEHVSPIGIIQSAKTIQEFG